METKKGMSVMTMVMILLLIVLVLLIFSFSSFFSKGSDNLDGYLGLDNNLAAVAPYCNLLCQSGNATAYCNDQKKPLPLDLGDGRVIEGSCAVIRDLSFDYLSNFKPCPQISCSTVSSAVCKYKRRDVSCEDFR